METKVWRRTRLDRMLVEYLLRQGYYETAMGLAETAGVGELTNTEVNISNMMIDIAVQIRSNLDQTLGEINP